LEATFAEPTKPGATTTFADFPIHRITPAAVRVLRDRKAGTPEAANGRVKAIRQVFKFGIGAKHAMTNPACEVPYFKAASDGFHAWSVEEVLQYRARHPVGTKAWLALALLLFVGGRRADIPALGRQHVRGGWLRYTQHKNRARAPVTLELPVLVPLQQAIDACPDAREHLTYLTTEFGRPFTPNGFGNWFKKRCREADLPHCSAHGLRKAGATLAAENGATERGWRTPKQAAHYTRAADQKKLAGAAMHLIDLDGSGNTSGPTSDSGGTFSGKR
jgi:site-specific recombinase XerD